MGRSKKWMPLYVGDLLADTGDLSAEETGAYLLLLIHYWYTGPLTVDHLRLARICKLSKHKFEKNWKNISRFFFQKDEKLFNTRMDKEIAKAIEISEKRAEAGRIGGEANAKAIAKQKSPQPQPHSTSVPSEQREAPNEPAKKAVNFWDIGVSMGITRSMIGKWVKDHGKHKTAQAIAAASIESAVDPIPYIQKVIANGNGTGTYGTRETAVQRSQRIATEELAKLGY